MMDFGEDNNELPVTMAVETDEPLGTQYHVQVVDVIPGKIEEFHVGSSTRGSTSSTYQLSPRLQSASGGSSTDRKNKFRLCLEVVIKHKNESNDAVLQSAPESDTVRRNS